MEWPWKKKKKDPKIPDQGGSEDGSFPEPDPDEMMRRQLERELDRMFPGMGKMWRQIEKELERTMPEMVRAMEEIMREMSRPAAPGQPLVGGIRIIIGPDGVPKIEKFGNVRVEVGSKPQVTKYREPLTDVFEDEDGATITVELPGVDKNDISIEARGNRVHIVADGEGPFKYEKIVNLGFETGTDGAEARFNNGILEIRVKRGGKTPGKIEITG